MTTEDFVSFETAKLLKERGFDEECSCFYNNIDYGSPGLEVDGQLYYKNSALDDEEYAAPTLQMAMKWLRENYEIFIQPNIVFLYPIQYFATIFCYGDNLKTQQDVETERFDTCEEACEAAIKYCVENLI